MKIALNITVEVNQEAWASEFGLDAKEVREDVRTYLENSVYSLIQELGLAP